MTQEETETLKNKRKLKWTLITIFGEIWAMNTFINQDQDAMKKDLPEMGSVYEKQKWLQKTKNWLKA